MVRVVYITMTGDNKFEIRKSNVLPTKAEMEEFFGGPAWNKTKCTEQEVQQLRGEFPEMVKFLGFNFSAIFDLNYRVGRFKNPVLIALYAQSGWVHHAILMREE